MKQGLMHCTYSKSQLDLSPHLCYAAPMKPILCLDFDGVIHSYTSSWKGADVIPDEPVPGAFEFIEKALGFFQVSVFSSRSNQEGGIEAMRKYIKRNAPGLEKKINFPTQKPPAFISIDDRAILFEGVWPEPDELCSFKPWNKRTP